MKLVNFENIYIYFFTVIFLMALYYFIFNLFIVFSINIGFFTLKNYLLTGILLSFLFWIVKILLIVLPLLISIAYFTLVERKILGFMQRRRGPNVVGFFGLLQPIADGVKLIFKETILPTHANKILFILAPIATFSLSLLGWAIIPFDENYVYANIELGVLYLFAISSLGVYGIICAGWSSNSKYALLGALRSAAQMISYEVSFSLILLGVLFCSSSLNLSQIILSQSYVWYIIPLLPAFIMFFISALAETNRPPFDLPEAEAELVAGYNVEYSSLTFALFFLAEYLNMIMMSALLSIFFLGGWLAPFAFLEVIPGIFWFSIKVCFFIFSFVWVRAAFPRLRYDQLMFLGWKVFLPLSLGYLICIAGLELVFFN